MFYPFKPKKRPEPPGKREEWLQVKIRAMQRAWAHRLNHQAQKIPRRQLKILLILFGVIASGAATTLICRGLSNSPLTIYRFDLSLPSLIEPITIPENVTKQQSLDRYLDSLERAIVLDSLQNIKPINSHDSASIQ